MATYLPAHGARHGGRCYRETAVALRPPEHPPAKLAELNGLAELLELAGPAELLEGLA